MDKQSCIFDEKQLGKTRISIINIEFKNDNIGKHGLDWEMLAKGDDFLALYEDSKWRSKLHDNYNCDFEFNDIIYNNINQYIEVNNLVNPGFDDDINRKKALLAKFTQNIGLKNILLHTKNAKLYRIDPKKLTTKITEEVIIEGKAPGDSDDYYIKDICLMDVRNFIKNKFSDDSTFYNGKAIKKVKEQEEKEEEEEEQSPGLKAFCGITNYGATCYMNSTMQFLYNMKTFRDEFIKIENNDLNKYGKALKIIFENLKANAGKKVILNPQSFKITYKENGKIKTENATKILLSVFYEKISESNQMDANEFIRLLFNKIGDLDTKTPNKVRPFLYKMFGFKQQVQINCDHNRFDRGKNPTDWKYEGQTDENQEGYTKEDPGTLQLSIKLDSSSIQEGLVDVAKFTDEELTSISGKKYKELIKECCKEISCDNEFGTGTKTTRIAFLNNKAPHYFITNYGRMSSKFEDGNFKTIFQNDKKVVNKKITLTSTFKDEEGNEFKQDVEYVLDGYILYLGTGMEGHYMFIKCDENGEESIKFNDSIVSKFTGESKVSRNAYIFSYKKID